MHTTKKEPTRTEVLEVLFSAGAVSPFTAEVRCSDMSAGTVRFEVLTAVLFLDITPLDW